MTPLKWQQGGLGDAIYSPEGQLSPPAISACHACCREARRPGAAAPAEASSAPAEASSAPAEGAAAPAEAAACQSLPAAAGSAAAPASAAPGVGAAVPAAP